MSQTAHASLAGGAAVMTAATAVSRITGFVRVVVVAAAMGTTFLANTYQTANTAPNVVFELVAAGVLTSVFVPTFVDYLVRGQREEGWEAANVLTSVALVALVGIASLLALAAPLVMRVLTAGVENDVLRAREVELGTTFLRLFAPQVVFYGAGMIMTGALHAYRRFAMPAVAPIFNNVVVIAVYLTYAAMRAQRPPTVTGITPAETYVLGAGTTLGVIAMTLCLIPSLRRLGWRFRFRYDARHPAVRKAARLGAWALGYAGGYQAGLIVVLLLANRIRGGVAAYQWAYTFFYLPHALFAVPIFNVLFPAMSEDATRGEASSFLRRLRDGLKMLFFILVPIAAVIVATSGPLASVTLDYGVMTDGGAALVGRVLAAFAIGLPAYSCFLVLTRAYYALGDSRTPTLVNAGTVGVASAAGAALFFVAPQRWAVAGLALGHSLAFLLGAAVLARRLRASVGPLGDVGLRRAVLRSLVSAALALAAMAAVQSFVVTPWAPHAIVAFSMTAVVGGAVYTAVMVRARSPELARILALARRRAT